MKSTNTDKVALQVSSILLNVGCIIFRPKQPFKYNTGIISPVYTDNRLILSQPKDRAIIVKHLLDKIKQIGIPDVIAGTATAGIPHASFIAQELNMSMVYVRPKPKEYGRENRVEGILRKGQKVIVIDDLISTARSSLEAVKAIREIGGKVSDIVAITTYGLKVSEKNLMKSKIDLHALTSLKTTAEVAVKNGYLKKEQVKLVLKWSFQFLLDGSLYLRRLNKILCCFFHILKNYYDIYNRSHLILFLLALQILKPTHHPLCYSTKPLLLSFKRYKSIFSIIN